jgi:transcriptional regulator with XRE-family HTH domain
METLTSPANHEGLKSVRKDLGRRIRALRRGKRWPQHMLAALCGIHVSHVSKIERGQANITLATLLGLAKNLGVSMADLFDGIG